MTTSTFFLQNFNLCSKEEAVPCIEDYSALVRPHLSTVASSGLLCTRHTEESPTKSSESSTKTNKGQEHLMRKGWENWHCSSRGLRQHFLLWGWLSTGPGFSGRLWHVHSWKHLKAIWTWSWVTHGSTEQN